MPASVCTSKAEHRTSLKVIDDRTDQRSGQQRACVRGSCVRAVSFHAPPRCPTFTSVSESLAIPPVQLSLFSIALVGWSGWCSQMNCWGVADGRVFWLRSHSRAPLGLVWTWFRVSSLLCGDMNGRGRPVFREDAPLHPSDLPVV